MLKWKKNLCNCIIEVHDIYRRVSSREAAYEKNFNSLNLITIDNLHQAIAGICAERFNQVTCLIVEDVECRANYSTAIGFNVNCNIA